MKFWRSKLLLLAGAAALTASLPASSQDAPESLLPPGFGDPENQPPPEPETPDPAPTPGNEQQATPSTTGPSRSALPIDGLAEIDEEDLEGLEPGRPLNYFAIPEGAARPVDVVGML